MRTIITSLWPLRTARADLGVGVFLNVEHAEAMAGLTGGEHVQLLEPNELTVEGIVHKVDVEDGRTFWFAEIGDPGAIQVIYREADPM